MESIKKPTLIIRADSSAKIGSGHLMRCFALAQSWKLQSGKVIFVTNCESSAMLENLKNEGFEVIEIENSYPQPTDWEITKKVLDTFPESWCIVDGYKFDSDYYGLIRENGNRVLAVDDTVRLPFYDADAILNQNIYAAELDYDCPPETELLLGLNYTLLRKEFLKWQTWQRDIPEIAQNILITLGGSDFDNYTLKVIRAIEHSGIENLKIRTVVGFNNPHLDELNEAAEISSVDIEIIHNAENMAELMAWADIAIAAAGSTSWEIAFLGLPSCNIVIADNQRLVGKKLAELEMAEVIADPANTSVEKISTLIKDLVTNREKRLKISRQSKKIVDGLGTKRIVEFLKGESVNK